MATSMYVDEDTDDTITDRFKVVFKRLKRKRPPPDLSEVVDFRNCTDERVVRKFLAPSEAAHPCFRPPEDWQVYEVPGFPDFTFIVNPFVQGSQYQWAKRCLEDFTCKPNARNLDAHMNLTEDDNLWKMYSDDENKELMLRLRWATLGYHHNWATKQYAEENRSDIPKDLASLASHVALVLGYRDYKGEAAVVNYYNMDSTLGGHVDHSEIDQVAPLISFSFGQSAVFMFGGKTKEVEPIPLFIHSGDIVIMAGRSRLCYHGVPKISKSPEEVFLQCLPRDGSALKSCAPDSTKENEDTLNTCTCDQSNGISIEDTNEKTVCPSKDDAKKCVKSVETDKLTVDPILAYLETHRVNMNVRQVLPPNQTTVVY